MSYFRLTSFDLYISSFFNLKWVLLSNQTKSIHTLISQTSTSQQRAKQQIWPKSIPKSNPLSLSANLPLSPIPCRVASLALSRPSLGLSKPVHHRMLEMESPPCLQSVFTASDIVPTRPAPGGTPVQTTHFPHPHARRGGPFLLITIPPLLPSTSSDLSHAETAGRLIAGGIIHLVPKVPNQACKANPNPVGEIFLSHSLFAPPFSEAWRLTKPHYPALTMHSFFYLSFSLIFYLFLSLKFFSQI